MTFHIRDDVCLIIDMECFFVDGQQHCRELGFCSWRGDCGLWPFHPRNLLDVSEISIADKPTTSPEKYTVSPTHRTNTNKLCHPFVIMWPNSMQNRTSHVRGLQGRYRGKMFTRLHEYSISQFGNNGMPQVRCTTCLGQRTPRDLRLASHSLQTPLCHDGMSRLFSMVLGLFQDTKSGC